MSARVFSVLALAVSLSICCAGARAEEVEATTAVTAVTVYPDRATVTRSASVEIPAGATTLVIGGLSENLYTDSLRAEATANGEVVLGALESKRVSSAELAAPRERELHAKLLELNDQRALLEADRQALEQKQKFLASLSEQAAQRARENIADTNLKPEQWAGAANTLSTSLAETLRAASVKGVELRHLDEQVAAVQSELNQMQTGARQTYQVRVPLEAKSPVRLNFRLTYQLPNATWVPIYDARLETATGKLTLTQFGEVRQQTGEDWTNIKLTLSTAQPANGAALPPLSPMWVDILQNINMSVANVGESISSLSVRNVRNNFSGQASDTFQASEKIAMAAPEERQATFQPATVDTGGFVSEYAIAGMADVKADGTARKVLIGSLDVSSEVMVKVKPQVSADAFVVAVTKLGGESPLLGGNASLFRDGAYIGSVQLPPLRPGEETDFGFGTDDQMVVKHRVMKSETGESGVLSRDTTLTRHTLTEIQNLHKMPVKVAVIQTVPASNNQRIKLTMLADKTLAGYDKDVDHISGQLRWTFDLAPQQKKDVDLGWTLSWPKDAQVSGLPF